MKKFKTKLQRFVSGNLFRTAKKLTAQRIDTTNTGRRRRAPLFHVRAADGCDDHEQLVAFDWIVTFEDVLVVRIPPTTFREWNIATSNATIAVTVIFRKR